MEEEDQRREAAIASDFKPKSGITSAQLSKFQELHKRRIEIKARSNTKKKKCGLVNRTIKPQKTEEHKDDKPNARNEDSNASSSKDFEGKHHALKKRHKLHWGLDTKERWEMKANM